MQIIPRYRTCEEKETARMIRYERAFKLSERFPFGYYYPGYHVTTQLLLINVTVPPAEALCYFPQKVCPTERTGYGS